MRSICCLPIMAGVPVISSFIIFVISTDAAAQAVPTGFQEYFLIGHAEQMWEIFDDITPTGVADIGDVQTPDGIEAVTTLTATTDIQMVIYDHWEDGYDPWALADPDTCVDPDCPQTSTLILGDNDPGNGNAANFSNASGDTINIDVALSWESRGNGTSAVTDFIPHPRVLADPDHAFRYDAPDRLLIIGGPVNLVHVENPRSDYIGGAMAVYPGQLLGDSTDYLIPVGEDLTGSHTEPFRNVVLQLQSYADGVTVNIDNGTIVRTFQLSRGDTWSSLGKVNLIDKLASAITIDAGTRVSADGPITALLATAGADEWEARFYSLLPEALFGNDYVTPVYGRQSDPNGLDIHQNIYVYNPHDVALNVTAYDSGGARTMTVGARSIYAYTQLSGRANGVPGNSTVRLTADRHFWGLAAIDYDQAYHDWGYGLVPVNLLTNSLAISWAPGNGDPNPNNSPNAAPVWISPLLDDTTIRVDWSGDGTYDTTYTNVDTMQSLRLYDSSDNDQTGMRIWGSAPFAAAYGQDHDVADCCEITDYAHDLGYEIMPQDIRFIDEVVSVAATANRYTLPTAGGTVDVTLTINTSEDLTEDVTGANVSHFLPTNFTYDSLVNVTLPGAGDPTPTFTSTPVASGTLLSWATNATMAADQILTLVFRVSIASGSGTNGRYDHEGRASGVYQGRDYNPRDDLTIIKSPLDVVLTVTNVTTGLGTARPDDLLDYTAEVINTDSGGPLNGITLRIPVPFDTDRTTGGDGGGTYEGPSRTIRFDGINLAANGQAGDRATFTIRVQVSVDALPGTVIINEARAVTGSPPEVISPPVTTLVQAPRFEVAIKAPSVAGPNCPFFYEVRVDNVGNEAASSVVLDMDIPNLTSYLGSLSLEVFDGATTTVFDPCSTQCTYDATPPADVHVALTPTLPAGGYMILRYQVNVTGTGGQTISADAAANASELVSAADAPTTDTPISAAGDADGDGIDNGVCGDCASWPGTEACFCTEPYDADTDDDGINDGDEWDPAEPPLNPAITDPCDWDSDDDGLPDGTESGIFLALADTDISQGHFSSDVDTNTVTDPNDDDHDNGCDLDGDEDANRNGRVDTGETDPLLWDDDDCDADGVPNGSDNCVNDANPLQEDLDTDNVGDVCDPDIDGDGELGATDCDDWDDTVYHGASELCDGKDNGCAGSVPVDEVDADGDTYVECSGWVGGPGITSGDCLEGNDYVNPGAAEVCDGWDTDCSSGFAAPDDTDEQDNDTDGYIECTGYTNHGAGLSGGDDCLDSDDTVYDGAPELCDGKDNICAGSVPTDEIDSDGDLYVGCNPWVGGGGILGGSDCNQSDVNNWTSCATCVDDDTDGEYTGCDAYVTINQDCDDSDENNWDSCTGCVDGDGDSEYTGCDAYVTINEDCNDSDINNWDSCTACVDTDSDGEFAGCDAYVTIDEDCDDSDINNWDSCTTCLDTDSDGEFAGCDAYVTIAEDCDDSDVNNWDSCTACVDTDTDGEFVGCDAYTTINEDCSDSDINNWDACADCRDVDGDTWFVACDAYVTINGVDCDDSDPVAFPGNPELCDGNDNDCDGDTPVDETDVDGDLWVACSPWDDSQFDQPTVFGGGDCDETNLSINPAAFEICTDGEDNDCDGLTDAGDTVDCPDGCVDADNDGYADAGCGGTDCNDANPVVNPGALEDCADGIDNNCDGDFDGDDASCPSGCPDDDGDGFIDDFCGGNDCDDTNQLINPAEGEDCYDGFDNDCDGLVDSADPQCPSGCADSDGDHYPNIACGGSDCDDARFDINPGRVEVCDDGVDNDCDGLIDGADAGECPANCEDLDLDGYPSSVCGGTDCDDGDQLVNPGAGEDCADDIDNNCDGLKDDLDPQCSDTCDDDDGDNYDDFACGGSDCDDTNLQINPGAGEHCFDGIDNNCDGLSDDDDPRCPENCDDADGDGYRDSACGGSDCDDTNANLHPGKIEVCNDGQDNNCDGLMDDNDPTCPSCIDFDGDGYRDIACGGTDCNDKSRFINPGAGENCDDAYDNNCDGLVDGDDPHCPTDCEDIDGDGYRDAACFGSDCDDSRVDVHPGHVEVCTDGVDNDCDGFADELDLPECDPNCVDNDGDGYRDKGCGGSDCDDGSNFIHPGVFENCVDGIDNNCDDLIDDLDPWCPDGCDDDDGDGYYDTACGGADCDDSAFGVNPGRVEACTDGIDNDCDALVDSDDLVDCTGTCADDVDTDGYYAEICGGSDCDDAAAEINPGVGEHCDDGIDNNCDGLMDGADPRCPPGCADADFDGYADAACGGSDCDDDNFGINPGRPENCADGADNDCDSLIDEGDVTECPEGCDDNDGDGFYDQICGGTDCDDTRYEINPGAGEHCGDGIDNNCSGTADDLDPLCPGGCSDADFDFYYAAACGGSDCDDVNFFTNPGAVENCADGVDNDCDGMVDEADLVNCPPGCDDVDLDGFYDAACGGTDCDDSNPFINPGMGEHCRDGVDNNCDGSEDDTDPFCPLGCADVDMDGYFDASCGGSDCDDTQAGQNPGVTEICGDTLDNDCDGLADEWDTFDCPAGCADFDSDGYLDAACGGTDCDDSNPFNNPGAFENCVDGSDNNCDGRVDAFDPLCPAGCRDDDGDGYLAVDCGGSDCADDDSTTFPGAVEDCTDGVDNNCDGLVDGADLIDCPDLCSDVDGDGYPSRACGGSDCDDTAFFINPGTSELCFNSLDDECDGLVDFDDVVDCPAGCADTDTDGYLDADCGGGDCAPLDPQVFPGAAERCDNSVDDNCDGLVDGEDEADCPDSCDDGDGDGYDDLTCGGSDCQDGVASVNPGAGEIPCDGIDNDCNILTLDPPDVDRDDFVAESCAPGNDCADDLPLVNPNAGEDCHDTIDNNCDDLVDGEDPLCPSGCADFDGDDYLSIACGGSDCLDDDANVNPGSGESCFDGIDNDCDGLVDLNDLGDCPPGCLDADHDGYRAVFCGGTDCDDDRFDIHPAAGENCADGVDNDCNGLSDDLDAGSCPPGCADADGDGYRDAACGGSDCVDADVRIHPAAGENCGDGVDNNCDKRIDSADPHCPADCADADQDGYGDVACGGSDCDDGNAGANPGGVEMCNDTYDNDCDGLADELDPSCPAGCADDDEDGYYAQACGGQDCDDGAAWAYPAAGENCVNGADDNCNGLTDGEDPLCPAECADADGDGYADAACGGSDCDDTADSVKPTGGEHCADGVDNDCDGLRDGDDTVDCPADCSTDSDGDGYLAAACGGSDCDDLAGTVNPGALESACNGVDEDCNAGTADDQDPTDADGDGFTLGCGGDCNDDNPFIHTAVAEHCTDGRDNDCDGLADEEDSECPPGCADVDGDGYRDVACGGSDCDDRSFGVNPAGGEHCSDGVDNNCDSAVDDQDDACRANCPDSDDDGYQDAACGGSDCDDAKAAVHPTAGEHCGDGLDNDCNGFADGDDWGNCPAGCGDADGDGYLDKTCGGTDCDDAEASSHPAAEEACDTVDNDCDGLVDEGYADDDADGLADCTLLFDGVGLAGGGCNCDAGGSGFAWLLLLVVFALRRRRRI